MVRFESCHCSFVLFTLCVIHYVTRLLVTRPDDPCTQKILYPTYLILITLTNSRKQFANVNVLAPSQLRIVTMSSSHDLFRVLSAIFSSVAFATCRFAFLLLLGMEYLASNVVIFSLITCIYFLNWQVYLVGLIVQTD